jgi:hypothetical protein
MGQGLNDTTQFGQSLEPANRRIAWLTILFQIAQNVLTVIRTEGDVAVFAPLCGPSSLFV